jgi:hypothetical protein
MFLTALLPIVLLAQDPLPKADPDITRAALLHHLKFLASDELKGRGTATPESARASAYIARSLERSGVQPGQGGSYFQSVPLLTTSFDGPPQLSVWGEGEENARALENGVEFSVSVRGDPNDTAVLRVVVVQEEEDLPREADPNLALVMHSSRRKSFGWLEAHGFEDGIGFGLIVRVRPTRTGQPRSVPRPRVERAWLAAEDKPDVLTVMGQAAQDLWDGKLERLQLSLSGQRRATPERNVVGVLKGVGTPGRPGLKDEVIVLSAHFDHVGLLGGEAPEGADVIRNGADDDASGCAVLMELAEALGAGPPPARTVVFLFCAAEELGMWGTYYYADNPSVPLEHIVCNLNLEMLGMPDELAGGPGKVWLTGFERTNLGPLFVEAGLDVGPDMRPEQHFFERSDNIVFVKKGIVGQTLSTGGDNPNYHQVSDEVETLDFDHMRSCARAALEAARLLASGDITPAWNKGEPKLGRR